MSGHLLATVNPEAVSTEIPLDLPTAGDMVMFLCRPGEGRRGKTEFPAMVMGQNDSRGRFGLDLLVIYDAQDVTMQESVQEATEQNMGWCWKRKPDDVSSLRAEMRELREENAALRRAVFGDWNEPEQGLMDYLVDFEKRTKAVEAAVAKTKAPTAAKAKSKA
jgi:hypothetical protein